MQMKNTLAYLSGALVTKKFYEIDTWMEHKETKEGKKIFQF
jgi:hypothetical protein